MLTESFVPENIFAGNVMPVVTETGTVPENQTIKKLAIVEKDSSGKIVVPSGTIDVSKAYALAAEEVVTGAGVTSPISLYMTGEFRASSIIVPIGKTVEDYKVPLRKLGIFIK